MSQFVALHPAAHKNTCVRTDLIEASGASERMVPVVVSELQKLIVNYPVVWTKKADTGEFICVALLGFDENENLFWEGGAWSSIYVPLNISRQPFFVGGAEKKSVAGAKGLDASSPASYEICIDQSSALVSEEQGEPLFESDNTESAYLQALKAMLAQLVDGEQQTQALCRHLLALDLLVPLQLELSFENGSSRSLQGVYTIDDDKIAQLADVDIIALQRQGFLQYIHLMQASLSHLYGLIDKKNKRNHA